MSINTSLVSFAHGGAQINLVDTPGYADFLTPITQIRVNARGVSGPFPHPANRGRKPGVTLRCFDEGVVQPG